MQWSFSNKASSSPKVLSFQEEKGGFDSLKSAAGLVSITTKQAFQYVQQNNILPQMQGAATHLGKHSIHHSITNPNSRSLTISPTSNASFVGQNHITSVSPKTIGSTELRNEANISSPDLLTVFYNGSVCVFDNVSLDKAQAIMLLARNSPPTTCSPTPPVAPAQESIHRSPICLDSFALSQPYNSACLSPLPIKSISLSQSACRSSNKSRDTNIVPPVAILESSFSIAEPLRAVYPLRSLPSTSIPSGTVPQFRKKSLARFLEKRKDRVASASPYAEKQS